MKLPLSPAGKQRSIPRSAEKIILTALSQTEHISFVKAIAIDLSVFLVFSECSLQCFVLYSLWCYIWCSLYSLVFSLVFYPRCWCSLWFPLLCSTSEMSVLVFNVHACVLSCVFSCLLSSNLLLPVAQGQFNNADNLTTRTI